jgi:hypothetical protein
LRTKSDLEPTVSKTLTELDEKFAQPILSQLQCLSLPLFVQCGVQVEIALKFVQDVENIEAAK